MHITMYQPLPYNQMPPFHCIINPIIITTYGADIEIKYSDSQVIQSSLTLLSVVNKEFHVECILKENARSCVTPTGYIFCCNDVYILKLYSST